MTATQQALALLRMATGAGGADVDPATVIREHAEGLAVASTSAGKAVPEWRDLHGQTAVSTTVALHEVAAAARLLATADLQVLLLPGASVLRFYPDAGCRPMDDVDLLCAPGQSADVADHLRGHGWTSVPRHPDLLGGRHIDVDLHDDLFHCERIAARRQAGWLDPNLVWHKRRRAQVEGIEFWVLGAEDEVIYTAAHALRHSYRRMTWLADLALQLRQPDLDPVALRARAEACGLARPLLYGLSLLRAAGVALPAGLNSWYDSSGPRGPQRRLLLWIVGARETTCAGELLWYWNSPSWGARARLLLEYVFPRPEVLLQVFPRVPRRLAPLAYALRCGQLVQRIGIEFVALLALVNRRAK